MTIRYILHEMRYRNDMALADRDTSSACPVAAFNLAAHWTLTRFMDHASLDAVQFTTLYSLRQHRPRADATVAHHVKIIAYGADLDLGSRREQTEFAMSYLPVHLLGEGTITVARTDPLVRALAAIECDVHAPPGDLLDDFDVVVQRLALRLFRAIGNFALVHTINES